MNQHAGWEEEKPVPFLSFLSQSLRDDLLLLFMMGGLGVAASYLSVKIPHTAMFIEARYAFGFMGFALIRRLWVAILLACLLAVSGSHQLPLLLVFTGNMLYAVPCLAVIRAAYWHVLTRSASLWWFGAGWLLLVLFCYQVLCTPVLLALLAVIRDAPLWHAVIDGWREQPFLIESFIVAIVSASGMVALRSHESLRRNRRELSITLDSIGDGVIAADARGRVTRMNPVALSLTGWPLEEARGKPLEAVFHIVNAQTREPVENPVARVLREGRVVGLANHTCLIARDGTERQIADSAAPLKESDGRVIGVVMVFRDITAQYKAQAALRESEEKYRTLIELSPDLIAVHREGRLLFINRSGCDLLGVSGPDAVLGRPLEDFFSAPRQREYRQPGAQAPDSGGRIPVYEQTLLRSDGEERIIEAVEEVMDYQGGKAVQVVARDVTERRQVEMDLRRRTEELEVAQQVAKLGSFVLYPETESLVWSRELYRIFGQDPEAGPPSVAEHFDLVHPEDLNRCAEAVDRALTRGEGYDIQFRLLGPGGKIKHLRTLARVDLDGGGKVERIFGTTQDITDQVRLQEEKARLETQFHQSQKLESVGRLAGGVAHDLNNLLAPILGYGEMLLENLWEEDSRRAPVEEMIQSGVRARDLVRQLLAFSRKQVLEFKPVDLNQILEQFEKLLRRTIREDVAMTIAPAPSIPLIRADTGQLEQVIMNLAVNAQDAMPEGGELTIETAATELDAAYAAKRSDVTSGPYVMLSVSDTGSGMDAETRSRLFEPFFTTKGKEKGTGLGLATVYGIVRQHGGNIWVYSEQGRGTTFKIYLPVSGDATLAVEPDSPETTDLQGAETILLVEDNEQVRDLTRAILRRQGYEVIQAANGEEALAVLDGRPEPIHLLLTDVIMPGMSGKDLFNRVVKRVPRVKVLYMSGYTDNVIAHRGVIDKGVNFIQKPFPVKVLAAKVREVLNQKGPAD
jgi:PAS domain S-box-containing protein